MKAHPLFQQRIDYEDGAIVEMVIWRVPTIVPLSTHGLKYSLFYGRPGIRQVGYDNATMSAARVIVVTFRVSRQLMRSAQSKN